MLKDLFTSKKFLVFLTSVIASAGVNFAGLPPEQATEIASNIVAMAMAYLGGQGVADMGIAIKTGMQARAAASTSS